jgi:hypothetical protein
MLNLRTPHPNLHEPSPTDPVALIDSAKTSLRPMIKKRSAAGCRCFFLPPPPFFSENDVVLVSLLTYANHCASFRRQAHLSFAYFMFSRILQCGILENLATLRHTPRGPRNHEFQGLMKEKCCKWWAMRSPWELHPNGIAIKSTHFGYNNIVWVSIATLYEYSDV